MDRVGTQDLQHELLPAAATSDDAVSAIPVPRPRRTFPFTFFFQSFLVLSLAVMVIIVLVLFKAASVVAVDGVREQYLHTAADEIAFDADRALAQLNAIAVFAPTLSKLVISTPGDHLIDHCTSLFHLFTNFDMQRCVIVDQNGVIGFCQRDQDSIISCGHGGIVDGSVAWSVDPPTTNLNGAILLLKNFCDRQRRVVVGSVAVDSLVVLSCASGVAAEIAVSSVSIGSSLLAIRPSSVDIRLVALDGATSQLVAGRGWPNTTVLRENEVGRSVALPTTNPTTRVVLGISLAASSATNFSVSVSVMVAVSIVILLATCVATALTLRLVLSPLSNLHSDMTDAVALRLEKIPARRSIILELDGMATTFTRMVSRLRSYNAVIAEFKTTLRDRSFSVSSKSSSFEGHANYHLLAVHLTYVTKRTGAVKRIVSFDHTYRDGDANLLDHLKDACKANVEAHRFELVTICVNEKGQRVTIATSRQLEEIIASSIGSLDVTMRKCSMKTLLAPINVIIDLAGLLNNLVIIFLMVFDPGFDSAAHLGLAIWASFYGFAICVNISLALWLLRHGRSNERFRQWLSQAGTEVSIVLLLASQSTQHLHFLWSGWGLGPLRFNAPRLMDVWRKSVRYSAFGFVFSELGQVAFKCYRLSLATGGAGFLFFCSLGLLLTLISMAMQLPKKLSLLASRNKDTSGRKASTIEEHTDFDAAAAARRRPRWGQLRTLTTRRVTVALFRVPLSTDPLRSSPRVAIECSFVYSSVFKHVKTGKGTVLFFHANEIAAVFNSPQPLENHFTAAVECAERVNREIMREFNGALRVHVVLACETMQVGMLGTDTRKSHQCFAPWPLIRRLAACTEQLDIPVTCTIRSRVAAPACDDVHFRDIEGLPNALQVSLAHPDKCVLDVQHAASRRGVGLIDESTYLCRLRSMMAPFGLQRVDDIRWAVEEVRKCLQRVAQSGGHSVTTVDAEEDSVDAPAPTVDPTFFDAIRARRAHKILGFESDDL